MVLSLIPKRRDQLFHETSNNTLQAQWISACVWLGCVIFTTLHGRVWGLVASLLGRFALCIPPKLSIHENITPAQISPLFVSYTVRLVHLFTLLCLVISWTSAAAPSAHGVLLGSTQEADLSPHPLQGPAQDQPQTWDVWNWIKRLVLLAPFCFLQEQPPGWTSGNKQKYVISWVMTKYPSQMQTVFWNLENEWFFPTLSQKIKVTISIVNLYWLIPGCLREQ